MALVNTSDLLPDIIDQQRNKLGRLGRLLKVDTSRPGKPSTGRRWT
jgi:hypothetical protein